MRKNKIIYSICKMLGNHFDDRFYEDLMNLDTKTLKIIEERLLLVKEL